MALLPNDAPWPPPAIGEVADRLSVLDAWWSGEPPERLTGADALSRRERGRFWTKDPDARTSPRANRLHVPLPADMTLVSTDLLFSEAPALAHEDPAVKSHLDGYITTGGLDAELTVAGEYAAAHGGVYLRVRWDRELSEWSWLSATPATRAIPTFRAGRLVAVHFWHVVDEKDDGTVWRVIEDYTPGRIAHGLYVGTGTTLGIRVDLASHPATVGLADEVVLPPRVMAAVYVPNALPSRTLPAPHGRSDLEVGITTGMFDALDEVWTSWMRDIRLGKARIVVPAEFVERRGRGRGARFDVDREVYETLDAPPDGGVGITPIEFAIRWEAHQASAHAIIERVVSASGYAPQSFGLSIDGTAQSGTALTIRERKSFMTQGKKQRLWTRGLRSALGAALAVDATVLGASTLGAAADSPVSIEWQDSIQHDVEATARSIALLSSAQVASADTLVRMLHPDWAEDAVEAEKARLVEQFGVPIVDVPSFHP